MEVAWVDQQKINEFSKLNTRLGEFEAQEGQLKQQKEDLDDLEMELELVDEDEQLLYRIGDSFASLRQADIMERLEADKSALEAKLSSFQERRAATLARMDELKAVLYAKFGRDNINLERD